MENGANYTLIASEPAKSTIDEDEAEVVENPMEAPVLKDRAMPTTPTRDVGPTAIKRSRSSSSSDLDLEITATRPARGAGTTRKAPRLGSRAEGSAGKALNEQQAVNHPLLRTSDQGPDGPSQNPLNPFQELQPATDQGAALESDAGTFTLVEKQMQFLPEDPFAQCWDDECKNCLAEAIDVQASINRTGVASDWKFNPVTIHVRGRKLGLDQQKEVLEKVAGLLTKKTKRDWHRKCRARSQRRQALIAKKGSCTRSA